jgi:uncharacterized protein (DUF1697 family)
MPVDARRVALLRAVNVGGRAVLRMADLKALIGDLGYLEPQTLLQSGNVVFTLGNRERGKTAGEIEARLERALSAILSVQSDVFVRSASQWADVVAANPFRHEARVDPSHLIVMVLKDAPAAGSVKALQASIQGREVVRASGRQLYIVYPDGVGRSKLTGGVIERTLGTRGTARNWNTVMKIDELARNCVSAA